MTADGRFQRLETLFHEMDALEESERASRLSRLAIEDPDLHAELLAMLQPSPSLSSDEQQLEKIAGGGGFAASVAGSGDPDQVGPYRLQRLLGEGGMGRVYLAEQDEPVRRRVALKLTRRGFDSTEAEARFRTERQALAVLDHPHIARVFDAGSTELGRPWFAMEYIDGVPITRWSADRRLGLNERIRLLLPVCDAVQHAHRKGLIHRDLKPSNILVIDDGKTGFPKVIDFGIARLANLELDDRSQVTRLGELVGTPEYMSPEQAALGEIDIDTRSDVYSLGLVLYELLVGDLPIAGHELRALGFEAMCREIRQGQTPRPSRFRPSEQAADPTTTTWRARLRGDLDSVLLKALAKDRDRRYGSPAELADDLKRYLDNQPVLAQPPSLGYRAGKFIRRNRALVGASAVVVLALLAATVISALGLVQARAAEEKAAVAAGQARVEAERATIALAEAEQQYELANAFLLGQRVYSDLLLELFSGQEASQELTDTLMERWRNQHADWRSSEDTASTLSLALGRNFYFRRDFASAHEIFSGWLEAGYGSSAIRAAGRELYASSLFDSGRHDQALPVLLEVLAGMEQGTRRSAVDRFNVAIRIANITRDPQDLARAESLYAQREQEFGVTSPNPAQRIENLAGLMNIRRLQGDLAGNAQVLEQMRAVYRDSPDFKLGRDIVNARLAELWLFDQGRVEEAGQLARHVVNEDADALGQSAVTARGWYLLARALIEGGHFNEAQSALDTAAMVHHRFSGGQALGPEHDLARALLQLGAGDVDGARNSLGAIGQALEEGSVDSTWQQTLELAQIYLQIRAGNVEASQRSEWLERLPPEPAINLELLFLHRRLTGELADPSS